MVMRQASSLVWEKAKKRQRANRLAVIAKFFCGALATALFVSFAHGENDDAAKQVNKSGAPAKRKAEELQKRTQADALVKEALFHEIYGETDQRDSIFERRRQTGSRFCPRDVAQRQSSDARSMGDDRRRHQTGRRQSAHGDLHQAA
jgi:hypothetical protein